MHPILMVEMERNILSIGQLARAAGVSVQALRFYERRKLLPRPERTLSGHRRYGPEALELLRIIRRGRELGFSLAEISELLGHRRPPDARCLEVCRAVRAKLDHVERQISELQAMRKRLQQLRDVCPTQRPLRECGVLAELEGKGSPKRRK